MCLDFSTTEENIHEKYIHYPRHFPVRKLDTVREENTEENTEDTPLKKRLRSDKKPTLPDALPESKAKNLVLGEDVRFTLFCKVHKNL